MADTDRWHEWTPSVTSIKRLVTLSLRYEGILAKLLARMTRNITNRCLAMEANGLKARAENPYFRHSN